MEFFAKALFRKEGGVADDGINWHDYAVLRRRVFSSPRTHIKFQKHPSCGLYANHHFRAGSPHATLFAKEGFGTNKTLYPVTTYKVAFQFA